MANTINQPDGSSVTPLNPVTTASTWTVVYEVDFTAEANSASLDSDDTISIAGKTWTAKNGADSAYCDDLKNVNGTGLQVQFGTGNTASRQSEIYATGPRTEILISSLVSGLSDKDTIAIQLQTASGSMSQDWQAYGMTISDNGVGTRNWICNRVLFYSGFTGSDGDVATDCETGIPTRYSLSRAGLAAEPAFHELVWYPSAAAFAIGADAVAPTQWQDPLTCSQTQIYGVMNAADIDPAATQGVAITPEFATLQLTAFYDDQGAPDPAWNATFTKLRVLQRKG